MPEKLEQAQYRAHLPDLSSPRFATMQQQNPYEYAESFKSNGEPPWLHALYLHWQSLFAEPFKGITNDGTVRPGLFKLQDQGLPIHEIVAATEVALSYMEERQKEKCIYHVDSPEWRSWSNPEFLLSDKGLRLDELDVKLRNSLMKILEMTISPEGYRKAQAAMRINGFLGELVQAPSIMNEYSYNFVFFGKPSPNHPWGFSFYGHHLCLNVFLYKSQIVLSPCFTGAEPNIIDAGQYEGTEILKKEESLGLQLMQSLSPSERAKAQVFKEMKDPAMPRGRWNHDDQRHLCGAYRDNRIVPYEGVLISDLTFQQQQLVLDIFEEYILYLPQTARNLCLTEIQRWFHETFFCWIGGFGDDDAFYYRIQNPVVLVEFDHHSGVFLNNSDPAKFHTHTLLRTPNAGDYGMALRPLIQGQRQDFLWSSEQNQHS